MPCLRDEPLLHFSVAKGQLIALSVRLRVLIKIGILAGSPLPKLPILCWVGHY